MRNARKMLLAAMMAVVAMAMTASAASAQSAITVTKEPEGTACPAVVYPGAGGETDVDGGCLVHARGEAELRKHVFGIESHITECTNEYYGRLANKAVQDPAFPNDPTKTITTAEGYILEQSLTNDVSGGTCTRQPCKENTEAIPWHATGYEGNAFGSPESPNPNDNEYLMTKFCVEPIPSGTDEECEIDVSFNETASAHVYEFGHEEPDDDPDNSMEMSAPGITGFRCELTGHWTSEVIQGANGMHDGEQETAVEVRHTINP